jgi:hypothetical protein
VSELAQEAQVAREVGGHGRDGAALDPDDQDPAGDGRRSQPPAGPAREPQQCASTSPADQDQGREQERRHEQGEARPGFRRRRRRARARLATPRPARARMGPGPRGSRRVAPDTARAGTQRPPVASLQVGGQCWAPGGGVVGRVACPSLSVVAMACSTSTRTTARASRSTPAPVGPRWCGLISWAHSGTGEVGIVVPFRGVYRTEGSGRIGGTLLWCLTPGRLSAAGATNVLGTDDHGRTRGSSTAAASTRAPTAPAVTGGHSSLRTEVAGAR